MAAAYKIIPGIVKLINVAGQIRAYEYSVADLVEKKAERMPTDQEVSIRSIQLNNISFQYNDLRVLRNFGFSLQKGDFLGITGESGRGKTTILNLLLGFLSPDRGEIYINEARVDPGDVKKYWPAISYVRQQSFLIHDTTLRNITLEEEGYDKSKIMNALEISGVDDMVEQFPEGFDKMITENGKNISGGQQQRIALARAVYKNADLILLDEPFNELDKDTSVAILNRFKELTANGKMVIMITHDKESLSYCNKIISLDEH